MSVLLAWVSLEPGLCRVLDGVAFPQAFLLPSCLFIKQTRALSPLLGFSSNSVFFCLFAYAAVQAVPVYSL